MRSLSALLSLGGRIHPVKIWLDIQVDISRLQVDAIVDLIGLANFAQCCMPGVLMRCG
jgi:hypothetical protein